MSDQQSLGPQGDDSGNFLESAFKAVRTAKSPGDSERDKLREAVCAYVDAMKVLGLPVERVLIGIKQIAARAGVAQSRSRRLTPERFAAPDAMIDQAVRWCIERYFADELS